MLPNGIVLTLDMALGEELSLKDQQATRYTLILLGLFREDVVIFPGTQVSFPSPSIGHLWPWSIIRFNFLYRKAVRLAKKGNFAHGYYMLGRAMHVLVDMACPVHAHPVWHYLRDPYERYVDYHAQELFHLPLPVTGFNPQHDASVALVKQLAQASKRELADATQSPLGWLGKRLGYRKPLNHDIVAGQARRLIPLAAACVRDLLKKFQFDAENCSVVDYEVTLDRLYRSGSGN